MAKKLTAFLLVMVLLVSASCFSNYALELGVTNDSEQGNSRYVMVQTGDVTLSNNKGTAKISVLIISIQGAKFRDGTLKLYKYVNGAWTTEKTWRNLVSSTNTFAFSDNSVAVQSGTQYKVKISITAYTSSTSENIVLQTTKTL